VVEKSARRDETESWPDRIMAGRRGNRAKNKLVRFGRVWSGLLPDCSGQKNEVRKIGLKQARSYMR